LSSYRGIAAYSDHPVRFGVVVSINTGVDQYHHQSRAATRPRLKDEVAA
jgi:hypothetical protein